MTTVTLSWILGYLPGRARTHWTLAVVYAASSLGEVALIALHAVQ